MASICKPQTFLAPNPFFFDGSRYFLGCLRGILERAGILREEGNWSTRIVTTFNAFPLFAAGGLIGTPNTIVTIRTQSRRSLSRSTTEQEQVCLQAFQPFDSTHNLSRKSLATGPPLLSPVPSVRFIALTVPSSGFFSSTLQISIATISAQGCVSSPPRKPALQRSGLLCGKPVKSFDPWACGLQKVGETLDSCFFPLTTHPRRLQHHDHEQPTSDRRRHRGWEHRRGEETSESPQTASTTQFS